MSLKCIQNIKEARAMEKTEVIDLLDKIIQYAQDQIGFEDSFERDKLIDFIARQKLNL